MKMLSATCLAIAVADRAGLLRLVERPNRFGGSFIAIEDEIGLIEVAADMAEANKRVGEIRQRVA
jgi:hypothetical protein